MRFGEVYIHWLTIRNSAQYFAIVIADDQCNDGDPRYYRLGSSLCGRASTSALRPSSLGSLR
jgi:hypothetical protein